MNPFRPQIFNRSHGSGRSAVSAFWYFSVGALCAAAATLSHAADGDDVVAVYAATTPIYQRERLPDGSFKPETYAFGEGGLQGGGQSDVTIDNLRFVDVAKTIAPALAAQHYVPCDTKDPAATKLLVIVYWGATVGTDNTSSGSSYQSAQSMIPPPAPPPAPPPTGQNGTAMISDPSCSGRREEGEMRAVEQAANISALDQTLIATGMANRQRDRQNRENAAIVGYTSELKRVESYTAPALRQRRQDVVDEIEESRYYVVLKAYDFQALWHHKEKKLLWETRFSIRERQHDFSKDLSAMAESASRYFGQNSGGLVRNTPRNGHVEIGEVKSLGPVR